MNPRFFVGRGEANSTLTINGLARNAEKNDSDALLRTCTLSNGHVAPPSTPTDEPTASSEFPIR